MPTRLRKSRKKRGTRVVGWGRVGQHRKSGNKGGKGHAGMSKHKWSWVVKYQPDYFGYHGFYRHPRPSTVASWVNVGQLDELYQKISSSGKVEEKDGLPVIDLASMGFEKLLGEGSVSRAYYVIVPAATARAVEKIEEVGGRIELLAAKS